MNYAFDSNISILCLLMIDLINGTPNKELVIISESYNENIIVILNVEC